MNARKKIDLLKYKQAIDLSYSFYKDKHRKGIKIPYFAYLSSVSNLIIENNGSTDEVIAALFHDLFEFENNKKRLNQIKSKSSLIQLIVGYLFIFISIFLLIEIFV